jgi:O-antigen ligase
VRKLIVKFFLNLHRLSLFYLLPLFIFLLPTQLGIHFWPDWSFISGVRIDYLSPTFYLEDAIALLLLFSFFFHQLFSKGFPQLKRKYLLIALFIASFILVNTFHSINPLAAFFKWGRLAYLLLLTIYLIKEKEIKMKNQVLIPFLLSLFFFSVIGIIQVFIKKTTGGLFYFLGERAFSVDSPGIALFFFKGKTFLRAYSTFSHPNSLAGFLGLSFFILLNFYSFFKKKPLHLLFLVSLIVVLLCLSLTFSFSIFLALIFSLIFYLIIKKYPAKAAVLTFSILLSVLLFSLIFPVFSQSLLERFSFSENIRERLLLGIAAEKLFSRDFLIGIGLNNFFNQLVLNFSWARYFWLVQPVHNIFLLILTEVGFVGLYSFIFLFSKTLSAVLKSKRYFLLTGFVFFLLTGLTDHYWLTLPQNLFLLAFLISLSFRKD